MTNNEVSYGEGLLVAGLQRGDGDAFSQLYTRFYQRVFYFSQRYVNEAEAEDITAETFVQLWRRRADFNDMAGIARFLFIVARNRCHDFHRKQKKRNERAGELAALMERDAPAIPFFEEDVRSALIALLEEQVQRLPERTREVFLLSFRDGMKPMDIAEKLGLSVKTIKNQKLSAINMLKLALKDHPLYGCFLLLITGSGTSSLS